MVDQCRLDAEAELERASVNAAVKAVITRLLEQLTVTEWHLSAVIGFVEAWKVTDYRPEPDRRCKTCERILVRGALHPASLMFSFGMGREKKRHNSASTPTSLPTKTPSI